jgi:hypothetical protein
VTYRSVAWQTHFLRNQRAVNTTIEKEVFSMWFAYIHCWATDVFSMDLLPDYVSSPVVNQKSVVERERDWGESSALKEEGLCRRSGVGY